ncbi:MAG: major capsid protein [Spirulina sp.]
MADLYQLWANLLEEEFPDRVMASPAIQFGTDRKRYLGAELLPEQLVDRNEYTETKVVFKTFPALDGTRYSEPKMQGQQLVGSFRVTLGEVDTASQLTGNDLDVLMRVAERDPAQAVRRLRSWIINMFPVSLAEKAEIQRWQAFVDAAVPIKGQDGNDEVIQLPNPHGHRRTILGGTLNSPAGWYGSDYDPIDDFMAVRSLAASKGYTIRRIVGDSDITMAIATNDIMRSRVSGTLRIDGGTLVSLGGGILSLAQVNAYLGSNYGLPAIEEYDTTYNSLAAPGQAFFKPRGALCFFCTTGRDAEFISGDDTVDYEIIPDTLGYYAIGTAVGQTSPGKVFGSEVKTMKPVGIYGQGFQTSFPVVTEPEAVFVLHIGKPED